MTRQEAKALGLKRFDGEPCKYGHDGLRYVNGGTCVRCIADRTKRLYWQDPAKASARRLWNRLLNLQERRAYDREAQRRWRKEHSRQRSVDNSTDS